MEQLDLTTPLTYPSTTNWKVVKLALDWYGQFIEIGLLGSNGERKAHSYSGSTALTLLNQLNTLNLSTISLQKRVLNRLVSDGVIAGTVSGLPD